MKVKMLYASFPTTLESDINRWLQSNRRANVIDIKYATGGHDSSLYRYTALIIYEE